MNLLDEATKHYSLSTREKQVLLLMFLGMNAHEIAEHMSIAHTTAQHYVKQLLLKTKSRNRVHMAFKILTFVKPSSPGRIFPSKTNYS
jgi:DNA-binding NarL/FixJ family response regulator